MNIIFGADLKKQIKDREKELKAKDKSNLSKRKKEGIAPNKENKTLTTEKTNDDCTEND